MYFLRSTCLGCIWITERAAYGDRALNTLHSLFRFVRQKGVAKDFEQPCLALAAGTAKGVDWRADPDIDETALLKHIPPACARQATGNSVGPQVDIAQRPRRNLLAIRNVGKLQAPARFQDAHDFGEYLTFVSA
jgi:hypothetical protein